MNGISLVFIRKENNMCKDNMGENSSEKALYSYYYFCKNETDEYIDLQHRIAPYAEIIPIPNYYPYDSTINVRIRLSKSSNEDEWMKYVLPYKEKAMVCIMGIPIQIFLKYLQNKRVYYSGSKKDNERLKILEDSVCELMEYYSKTKEELYDEIRIYYGEDLIKQEFKYTYGQYEKYKSIWNRPDMLPRNKTTSYDSWYNVIWKSEMLLYNLVKAYYPDAIMHYKDSWLGQQHLDIYVPSKRIAFEYHGQQHYENIEFFGGEYGLYKRKVLDFNKRKLCEENNITLIEWEYYVPIYPVYFVRKLKENGLFNKEIVPSIKRKVLWEDMSLLELE